MNILIIGLGSIARKHIVAITTLFGEVNLFALRSSASASDEKGITNINQLSELAVSPDFIIISNPTYLHAETIRQCIGLKRPLLIEKPLSHSLTGMQEILDLVSANQISTYIACNLRFHPVIKFLKEKLDTKPGKINEVNIYCGSYLPDWRLGTDFRTGYSANENMGGGVHLDLVHEIDYAFWLFGKPAETVSVKRSVSTILIQSTDFASYNLLHDAFTVNIILNYYRRTPKRSIEIVFDNEIYYADLLNCKIVNAKNEIIFEQKNFHIMDTYLEQMRYFKNCIDNNTQPFNSIGEAFEILKITLHEEA